MRCVLKVILSVIIMVLFPVMTMAAESGISGISSIERIMISVAAMLSVASSCVASAYALSRIGSAALGAMSEKPELGGRAIVFLGMAEGIAIYGLIVAIMLINRI